MLRLRIPLVALAMLALATIARNTQAQDRPDGPLPREGAGPGGPNTDREWDAPGRAGGMRDQRGPAAGFHLLPRFVAEELDLTAEQQKQIAELEKQTKAKLFKILTPEQRKMIGRIQPPRPMQAGPGGDQSAQPGDRPFPGRGRRGQGGPGQGGQRGGPQDRGGPEGPGGPGGERGPGPDRDPPPPPADEQ